MNTTEIMSSIDLSVPGQNIMPDHHDVHTSIALLMSIILITNNCCVHSINAIASVLFAKFANYKN